MCTFCYAANFSPLQCYIRALTTTFELYSMPADRLNPNKWKKIGAKQQKLSLMRNRYVLNGSVRHTHSMVLFVDQERFGMEKEPTLAQRR